MPQIRLGDIPVEVQLKDVKNVHLSVHPPHGAVRISAPARMKLDTIRVYAISRLGWIKEQQAKLRGQERESRREYVDRESHYVWGKRYLMSVREHHGPPTVELRGSWMIVRVRPGTDDEQRARYVQDWYRSRLKSAVPPLLEKWQPLVGVKARTFFVQRMRTKWGSCNHQGGTIRLNTELAKKPPECLEYLVVHELVHLRVPTHGPRFVALMDRLMPRWRSLREQLNSLPVSHVDWNL
jgi:predicted metal-dependent hydrolase